MATTYQDVKARLEKNGGVGTYEAAASRAVLALREAGGGRLPGSYPALESPIGPLLAELLEVAEVIDHDAGRLRAEAQSLSDRFEIYADSLGASGSARGSVELPFSSLEVVTKIRLRMIFRREAFDALVRAAFSSHPEVASSLREALRGAKATR